MTKRSNIDGQQDYARPRLTRRAFASGMLVTALGGCTTTRASFFKNDGPTPSHVAQMYRQMEDGPFTIPAVRLSQVQSRYYRQEVKYKTSEKPGTIIVNPHTKFLYLVQNDGTALRYGIGVGRQGFSWSGRAEMRWKRKWPTWTPPAEMIEREPELAEYAKGMEPGLRNPLGARALYLFQGGKDTLYRIHGTLEAYSIGKAVSSGCIRLLNQDVIDLYDRAEPGATVIVIGSASRTAHSSADTRHG